jgi:hypothetical protein
LVSSQVGQTLFKWNYTVQTSARGINAISDYITINLDNGWQAGPNDDQYYTLGCFFGYNEGKVDSTSVLLELNLMFQTNNGLPTITFQALQNGVSQFTFRQVPLVGATYNRQVIVTPPVSTDTSGDTSTPVSTVTWSVQNIGVTSGKNPQSFQSFSGIIPASSRFNGLAYDGITWWTYSPAPTSNPLEYDASITNYGYSLDYGNTWNIFHGSEMSILTDGRYATNTLIYPVGSFHMVVPGQPPKIGMLRT